MVSLQIGPPTGHALQAGRVRLCGVQPQDLEVAFGALKRCRARRPHSQFAVGNVLPLWLAGDGLATPVGTIVLQRQCMHELVLHIDLARAGPGYRLAADAVRTVAAYALEALAARTLWMHVADADHFGRRLAARAGFARTPFADRCGFIAYRYVVQVAAAPPSAPSAEAGAFGPSQQGVA